MLHRLYYLPKSKFTIWEPLLKIAFDGDAVIFSDDSEKFFHKKTLKVFIKNEVKEDGLLETGPFKPFLIEMVSFKMNLKSMNVQSELL